MNCVFADTWFFLAILNPADPYYARAMVASRADRRHRVTTDWVLLEIGDALCRSDNRDTFVRFHDWIQQHPGTMIIPASRQLLEDGIERYLPSARIPAGELYRGNLEPFVEQARQAPVPADRVDRPAGGSPVAQGRRVPGQSLFVPQTEVLHRRADNHRSPAESNADRDR